MSEIWKDIVGFEEIYKVSNLGNVISLPNHNISCGRKRGNKISKRLDRAGYFKISLSKKSYKNTFFIHRIISIAFIPNPDNKPCVNHINSIRTDNRIENLEWCTFSENNKHAYKSGNQIRTFGESHNQSKLSELQVREIRDKYKKYIYTMPMLSK